MAEYTYAILFQPLKELMSITPLKSMPRARTFEERFTVPERFDLIKHNTTGVATTDASGSRVFNCSILSGPKGIGKTYAVLDALHEAGYTDVDADAPEPTEENLDAEPKTYKYVKGYASAKGVFITLSEHHDQLIIFDDCDSVFKDRTAANILKAATDTQRRRRVSWTVQGAPIADFTFTGGVLLISNEGDSIPAEIVSRSVGVKLQLTRQDILTRMRMIAALPTFMPEYSDDSKVKCIDFIETLASDNNLFFDLRVLTIALKAYHNFPAQWQMLTVSKMYLPLE